MTIKPKILISIIIVFFSAFLFCKFRTVPVSRMWKGYKQLYVTSSALTEGDVLTILHNNGCRNVVSKSNQGVPVISGLSPVQLQENDSYLVRRNAFFHDKSGASMVFYVPENETKSLEKSILEISAFNGTSSGTDGTVSFPWISPVLCLILSIILFFNSKNSRIFSIGAAFPILFAFCRPMFTVSAASCFLIFFVYLFQRFWNREGFLKIISNSLYFSLLSASPLLLLIFSSPINAFFYILCFCAVSASFYLYHGYETLMDSRQSFRPVYIKNAKMIPTVEKKSFRLMASLIIFTVALIGISKISGSLNTFSQSGSRPELPSPVKYSDELPGMQDIYDWSWNTITFPYRKINSEKRTPMENDTVSFLDYAEINGRLTPVEKQIYTYDNRFKEEILNGIYDLTYPSVEKMLLEQGKNSNFGYTKGAKNISERFGNILLIVFALIPTALCIYYIWGRKRYGLSI